VVVFKHWASGVRRNASFQALQTKPSQRIPGRTLLTLGAVLPRRTVCIGVGSPTAGQTRADRFWRGGGVSAGLSVLPGTAVIDGSYGLQTLSVVANSGDGSSLDVTPRASLHASTRLSSESRTVSPTRFGDGACEIVASYNGQTARAKVTVKNTRPTPISLPHDITPILLKDGCNGRGLSRRTQRSGRPQTLLLRLRSRQRPRSVHDGGQRTPRQRQRLRQQSGGLNRSAASRNSGGKRFAKGGAEYRTLVAWIRAGGPLYQEGETRRLPVERAYSLLPYRPSPLVASPPPALETISVLPNERTITAASSTHQLIVTATTRTAAQKT